MSNWISCTLPSLHVVNDKTKCNRDLYKMPKAAIKEEKFKKSGNLEVERSYFSMGCTDE